MKIILLLMMSCIFSIGMMASPAYSCVMPDPVPPVVLEVPPTGSGLFLVIQEAHSFGSTTDEVCGAGLGLTLGAFVTEISECTVVDPTASFSQYMDDFIANGTLSATNISGTHPADYWNTFTSIQTQDLPGGQPVEIRFMISAPGKTLQEVTDFVGGGNIEFAAGMVTMDASFTPTRPSGFDPSHFELIPFEETQELADLEVTKELSFMEARSGGDYYVEYEITLTNHGPSDVTEVVFYDNLLDGHASNLEFIGTIPKQGADGGPSSYSAKFLHEVHVNHPATFIVGGTVSSTSDVVNSIEIASFESYDPNLNNNFDEVIITSSDFPILDAQFMVVQPLSDFLDSPRKQIKNGIAVEQVQCNAGLELSITSVDNMPVCLQPETKPKLIERGWMFS